MAVFAAEEDKGQLSAIDNLQYNWPNEDACSAKPIQFRPSSASAA